MFVVAPAAPAGAQDWPTRPVTMVVPYAAGGPVDTLGRILGARLSEVLGQQVTIENVGGAGGMTGSARVAKAAPDGYTFLMGGSSVLAMNQTLYKHPLYDAATDFAPVALVTDSARVLITRNDFPANNFLEFVAYAKANQNKMQYGTAGGGLRDARLCDPARPGHGHQDHARALSRLGAGHAGHDRRAVSISSPSRFRPRCRRSRARR